MEKVACAMITVQNPRSKLSATNNNKSDRPVITSGMTRGANTSPENNVRPRKRPMRANTMAASVPRIVDIVAETSPTRSVTQAASIRA